MLIYLLQNNAPQQVVERTLLEQFADKNLSYDERFVPWVPPCSFSHREAAVLIFSSACMGRSISIMKVARAKLREIGPDDVDMEEYRVRAPCRGVSGAAARRACLHGDAGREDECT